MTTLALWTRKGEFAAYVGVSVIALLVDILTLYALAVRLTMDRPLAAAIAYLAGLVVHYAISVTRVFHHRRYGHMQVAEFVLYAMTGFLGVVVSYLVIWGGDQIGVSLWTSKSAAVMISFTLTYIARKWFMFSPGSNPEAASDRRFDK